MRKLQRVRLTKTNVQEFKPIKIKLEFEIETQEELDEWKEECEEGIFAFLSTEYSSLMFDVIKSFKSIK